MDGTIRLIKVAGIPVRLHWSFGLLFLAIAAWGWRSGLSVPQIALAGLLVTALFLCVVLHELGHAGMARYYQIRTHDIIILPIGGIARLDRLPDRPLNEFFIALAGPAVNAAIALVILGVLSLVYGASPVYLLQRVTDIRPLYTPYGFLTNLWQANLLLALFNMIPAFPLDGGRVLRAALSMRLGRWKATRIAAAIGQFFATAIFFHGLWMGDIIEMAIAVFVFIAASGEIRNVAMNQRLSEYQVADIMRPMYTRMELTDTLDRAFDSLKRGMEGSFLVFDAEGRLAGVLDETAVIRAWKNGHLSDLAGNHLTAHVPGIRSEESVLKIYALMQQQDYSLLPVVANGEIIGVVDDKAVETIMRLS